MCGQDDQAGWGGEDSGRDRLHCRRGGGCGASLLPWPAPRTVARVCLHDASSPHMNTRSRPLPQPHSPPHPHLPTPTAHARPRRRASRLRPTTPRMRWRRTSTACATACTTRSARMCGRRPRPSCWSSWRRSRCGAEAAGLGWVGMGRSWHAPCGLALLLPLCPC